MTTMYRMQTVCAWPEPDLPRDVMYGLPNLQAIGRETSPASKLVAKAERLSRAPSNELEMLEGRQLQLLRQLEDLHKRLLSMKSLFRTSPTSESTPKSATTSAAVDNDLAKDVVINVDPDKFPYSLLRLMKSLNVKIQCHVHSSVSKLGQPAFEFQDKLVKLNSAKPDIVLTLIWKKVSSPLELVVPNMPVTILGEVNVLRYLVSAVNCGLSYADSQSSWEIDSILDVCHRLQMSKNAKDKQTLMQSLSSRLGKQKWLANTKDISVADIAAWSALKQIDGGKVPPNLKDLMKKCEV